jgi:hypothetical protein
MAAAGVYTGSGSNGDLNTKEAAFADLYALVTSTIAYGSPSQVPASWSTGVSIESMLPHLQCSLSLNAVLKLCDIESVRTSDRPGIPGFQIQLYVHRVIFPVADMNNVGHYFAPGHYLHVMEDFHERWRLRLLAGGNDMSRLVMTPSGAVRLPEDGPPTVEAPAPSPSLRTRARARSRSRNNHRAAQAAARSKAAPLEAPGAAEIGGADTFEPIKGEVVQIRVPGRYDEYENVLKLFRDDPRAYWITADRAAALATMAHTLGISGTEPLVDNLEHIDTCIADLGAADIAYTAVSSCFLKVTSVTNMP